VEGADSGRDRSNRLLAPNDVGQLMEHSHSELLRPSKVPDQFAIVEAEMSAGLSREDEANSSSRCWSN
jgi:hypothetical protein